MSPKAVLPEGNERSPKGSLGRRIASAMEKITLDKVTEEGFVNARANAAHIAGGMSIAALAETPLVEGESALVVAAGPSMHRYDTARLIKESGFKGIIIATDSAIGWCLRHGIVPHLAVTVDPHQSRIVRWFGDPDLNEEKLAQDDYFARQDMDPKFRENQLQVNRELLELVNRYGPQISMAVASSASPEVVGRILESRMPAYWWNPMYDDYEAKDSTTRRIHAMNGLPCVNAGGNVGSACWVLAHSVLGKRRVGLVGMDFGYYMDTPYSGTQKYKELKNLVGEDRLDEMFITVQNPYLGREFYTDSVYLWYRDAFLEMVQQAECETFNCTGGGTLFGPGINWTRLPEFLSS